jgi:fumarate reductase subunit C
VAWFVLYLLMLVHAINQGEAAYQSLLAWSADTSVLLLNLVSFGFIVYHAITFFIAAPQAMVVHVGGKRLPGVVVGGAHYLGLIVVSAVLAWVLLGAS